jgi:ribonuclease HI
VVARDCNGKAIFAACSPIPRCCNAEETEAKAALRGLKLLKGLGHERIILETDCAAVASALRSPETDRSLLWAVYDEAKVLLKGFTDFRINHTRRKNNRVADGPAAMARSAGSCLWTAELPDHIVFLVTEDCNNNKSI